MKDPFTQLFMTMCGVATLVMLTIILSALNATIADGMRAIVLTVIVIGIPLVLALAYIRVRQRQ